MQSVWRPSWGLALPASADTIATRIQLAQGPLRIAEHNPAANAGNREGGRSAYRRHAARQTAKAVGARK